MPNISQPVCVLVATLASVAAMPVASDTCRITVAGLFHGGPLDPFVRPKRREVTISVFPDGTTAPVTDVMWESVMRSISHSGAAFYLTFDGSMWSGPSFEGPWTSTGTPLPDDFEQMTRQMADQNAANLTETRCAGDVEIDGKTLTKYVYRTKTDPSSHGSWFGGRYSAYIDPVTGQLARLEIADMVSSWAPEPTSHYNLTTVTYDSAISVVKPD